MNPTTLREVKLRILYPATAKEHIATVKSGLETFGRLGVLVESACIDDKDAFRHVKYKKTLRSVASAQRPIHVERIKSSIIDQFNSDMGFATVFGLAITTQPLMSLRSESKAGSREILKDLYAGFGVYMGYAALSLEPLSHVESFRREMLISLTMRKAGKLFIKDNGDCTRVRCIMHEASSFENFVARHSNPRLDFCVDCSHSMIETIDLLRYSVMGDMFGSLRR